MAETVTEDLAAMEKRWPGWRIRRTGTDDRMWSAVREGRQLTVAETSIGLAMTLLADTEDDLVFQLDQQGRIGGA